MQSDELPGDGFVENFSDGEGNDHDVLAKLGAAPEI